MTVHPVAGLSNAKCPSLLLSQESSGIEVFWRPLSDSASTLVFFSRRTDMPYRYTTSLGKLNYTTGVYKVCCGPA